MSSRALSGPTPELARIGVGVDPAVSSEEGANLTGIVVAGLAGSNKHGYVLGDHSLRASPEQWATKAVSLYHQFNADIIVAEKNQGGELVESTIRTVDPNANVKLVHASKGKIARAEPVAALYEQNRIHHVGTFPELEDEMCLFLPGESNVKQLRSGGKSPDRADAAVWVLTELMDGINRSRPWLRRL
jgi:phage terminase large subunit-like protein